jgi:hypothetical protein
VQFNNNKQLTQTYFPQFHLLGSHSEAIRELDQLYRRRETELPAALALIHIHKLVKLVDHEAVAKLEMDISSVESRANESALLLAATFTWHIKKYEEARKFVMRAQDMNPNSVEGNVLRGWIDVTAPVTNKKERDIYT